MLKHVKKFWTKGSSSGQNMIEYILVVAGVVVALLVTLGPSGFLSRKIDQTMNKAMVGTKCVVLQTCFDPKGCPTVCGNDCCEAGESINTCPDDCALCSSDAECDDGIACNGVEKCDPAKGCRPGGLTCPTCRTPEGDTIQPGECRPYFQNASVPYGGDCGEPQERCCDESRHLSGSYTATGCTVSPPGDCGSLPHGGSGKFYKDAVVPCGDPCEWEINTCDNGVLFDNEGNAATFTETSCTESCLDCTDPDDGSVIPSGTSRRFSDVLVEECWTVCHSQSRRCDGVTGMLDGDPSYIYHAEKCDEINEMCDDGNSCTDDFCVPNRSTDLGCVHQPNHSLCDDGFSCTGSSTDRTVSDRWYGGELWKKDEQGGEVVVDGVGIGQDWCDPVAGCQFEPRDGECDDGASCSEDHCAPSYDYPGYADQVPPVNCSRAYGECADASDYESNGCRYFLDHTQCEDQVDCTANWCDPGNPDDPNAGTGCRFEPDDSSCNDRLNCTTDWCDISADCQHRPDHAMCEDGKTCTGALSAGPDWTGPDGEVVPGWDVGDDYCDVNSTSRGTGCVRTPDHAKCDDGQPCTYQITDGVRIDQCSSGGRQTSPSGDTGCTYYYHDDECDDGVECTRDRCTAVGGNHCENTISLGLCTTVKQKAPDPCKEWACDESTGWICQEIDRVCPHPNKCYAEYDCDPNLGDSGQCVGVGNSCDDGDPCTDDICISGVDGQCVEPHPCICPVDCNGVCGGDAVEDECGVCEGSGIPAGECDCEGNVLDECGVCGGDGIPAGECDCDGNVPDCAGVCGGTDVVDECGVCGGDGIPAGECDCDGNVPDCAGVCGGTDVVDECGVCGGDGIPAGECDCNGNVLDCAGVCGGDAVEDECGVCGGSDIPPGDCDCDGNVLDACGDCGGGVTDVATTCSAICGNQCETTLSGTNCLGDPCTQHCGGCSGYCMVCSPFSHTCENAVNLCVAGCVGASNPSECAAGCACP